MGSRRKTNVTKIIQGKNLSNDKDKICKRESWSPHYHNI